MTPRQLISILYDLPSESMDKDIWIDGHGYLEEAKDRKHGLVLSVYKGYKAEEFNNATTALCQGSAPSRSRR